MPIPSDFGKHYENVPAIIKYYEDMITEDAVELRLHVTGRSLEQANKEQSQWYGFYLLRRAELKQLCKKLQARINGKRFSFFKSYTSVTGTAMAKALTDRQIEKYIDNEPEVVALEELFLEFEETYEKFNGIVDAFQQRGYSLRNITEARVAQVHTDQL